TGTGQASQSLAMGGRRKALVPETANAEGLIQMAALRQRAARAEVFDHQLPFSWLRWFRAALSYLLLFSDVPRSGLGIRDVHSNTVIEPSMFEFFGPWAYSVQQFVRNGTDQQPASVWSYKFDTTSVVWRAFAEYFHLATFPRCLFYEADCPGDTLNSSTTFAMMDSLATAVAAHHISSIILRTVQNYHDRLHNFVLPQLFVYPLWRTSQALYYPSAIVSDPFFVICQGPKARPFACSDLWTNYRRSCSPKDDSCQRDVGVVWEHIVGRIRSVEKRFPNHQVDLTVLESAEDTQVSRGSFCMMGSRDFDVSTIIRSRACVIENDANSTETCETVFAEDYRYEGGMFTQNVVDWYSIVSTLRICGQVYFVLRVVMLVHVHTRLDEVDAVVALMNLVIMSDPVVWLRLYAVLLESDLANELAIVCCQQPFFVICQGRKARPFACNELLTNFRRSCTRSDKSYQRAVGVIWEHHTYLALKVDLTVSESSEDIQDDGMPIFDVSTIIRARKCVKSNDTPGETCESLATRTQLTSTNQPPDAVPPLVIKLKEGATPHRCNPRRYSPVMKEHVEALLDAGFINKNPAGDGGKHNPERIKSFLDLREPSIHEPRVAARIALALTTDELTCFHELKQRASSAIMLEHMRDDWTVCVFTFTDASHLGWGIMITQVQGIRQFLTRITDTLMRLSGTLKVPSCIEKEAHPIIVANDKADYILHRERGYRLRLRSCDFDLHLRTRQSTKETTYGSTCSPDGLIQTKVAKGLSCYRSQSRASHLRTLDADTFEVPEAHSIRVCQDRHDAANITGLALDPVMHVYTEDGKIWVTRRRRPHTRLMIVGHCGSQGHRGAQALTIMLADRFAITRLLDKCDEFCANCLVCVHTKGGRSTARPWHGTDEHPDRNERHLMLHREEGQTYVLVNMDAATNFVKLFTHDATTATNTAMQLLEWGGMFGFPSVFVRMAKTWVRHRSLFLHTAPAEMALLNVSNGICYTYCVRCHWTPSFQRHSGRRLSQLSRSYSTRPCALDKHTTAHARPSSASSPDLGWTHKSGASKACAPKNARSAQISWRGDYVLWSTVDMNIPRNKLRVTWVSPYQIIECNAFSHVTCYVLTQDTREVHESRLKFFRDKSLNVTEEILAHIGSQDVLLAVEEIRDVRKTFKADCQLRLTWKGLDDADASLMNLVIMTLVPERASSKRLMRMMALRHQAARSDVFDHQLPFSWLRWFRAAISYMLLFSDVPRSGLGIRNVSPHNALEPTMIEVYGPWAYSVLQLTRNSTDQPPATVWSYKFDTTSIVWRAFAAHFKLTTFPRGSRSATFEVGVQSFRDRLHHYVLPQLFVHSLWRTNQALYYPSSVVSNPFFAICQGPEARPFACNELWTNYRRSCSPHDASCRRNVGVIWEHIVRRIRSIEKQFPGIHVDLTVLESTEDIQVSKGSFSGMGSGNFDVSTIIRARRCDAENKEDLDASIATCETVFAEDFRYEGGVGYYQSTKNPDKVVVLPTSVVREYFEDEEFVLLKCTSTVEMAWSDLIHCG
ncbi:TPA: LOW QUALITY PROTEIN: hypothetical protein N0F65_011823, partial [Lagenidium giganteum]